MIHCEGKLGDTFVRSSTHTRTWNRATKLAKAAEASGTWADTRDEDKKPDEGKLIADAIADFLLECKDEKGRNLAVPTIRKYRTLFKRLQGFADGRGMTRLDELDFTALNEFKRSWNIGALAAAKTISRLRAFMAHAVRNHWIERNVAQEIPMPKNILTERQPFTDEEMSAILEAARIIELDTQQPVNNFELETFILVMRWSGIAISDTALLQKTELRGDEIRLYRKKMRRNENRTLVVVPLPADVLARLKKLPLKGTYFFAHGTPNLSTQVEAWRKRLAMVFKAAGVRGTSHQFRHSFATDLLGKGVPIELVARYLGNSVRVCEKHYSHWIESRVKSASDVLRKLYA
jgi:site-specific recombinase XerD